MIPLTHRVGEIGVVFRATLVDQDGALVNIAGATLLEIVLRSPAGVRAVLAADYPAGDTGAEGRLQAVTDGTEISAEGIWQWQTHAVGASFDVWSQIATFVAEANL